MNDLKNKGEEFLVNFPVPRNSYLKPILHNDTFCYN